MTYKELLTLIIETNNPARSQQSFQSKIITDQYLYQKELLPCVNGVM